MRRLAWSIFGIHAVSLAVGLAGILIAIPHPELWAGNGTATAVYNYAIAHTGGASMVLGALAMFVWGLRVAGVRATLTFFVAATLISATAELLGTSTGWPFGGYEYLSFLGEKIMGRVPYSIPLSWFSMGLASFLLAETIFARRGVRGATIWSLALGAWLLTAWDLVLDPAMASPALASLHFWHWYETGPYFGMPLRNLAGWIGTGIAFMAVGSIGWNARSVAARFSPVFPLAFYAINVVWAMAIALGAGLWPTALAAVVFSLAPACLAVFGRTRRLAQA